MHRIRDTIITITVTRTRSNKKTNDPVGKPENHHRGRHALLRFATVVVITASALSVYYGAVTGDQSLTRDCVTVLLGLLSG